MFLMTPIRETYVKDFVNLKYFAQKGEEGPVSHLICAASCVCVSGQFHPGPIRLPNDQFT